VSLIQSRLRLQTERGDRAIQSALSAANVSANTHNVFLEIINIVTGTAFHSQLLLCPRNLFTDEQNRAFDAGLAAQNDDSDGYSFPLKKKQWHNALCKFKTPLYPLDSETEKQVETGNFVGFTPGCITCGRLAYGGGGGSISGSGSSSSNTDTDVESERCSGLSTRVAYFEQGVAEGAELGFHGWRSSASKYYLGTTEGNVWDLKRRACASDCGAKKFTADAYSTLSANCNHVARTLLGCFLGLPAASPGSLPSSMLVGSDADCSCAGE